MNIAMFLKPKVEVEYLYDDFTVRQALEKMCHHGYTAIPVITRSGKYYSTIREGDLLWYIVDGENTESAMEKIDIRSLEDVYIRDIIEENRNPPVRITEPVEQLFERALNQNYVPVIDDMDSFIGIITRRDILKILFKKYTGKE
ncbi:MAG: CBS domain-containing protein [Clostridiales bacterium]|nr:CBS domain-containing protein [Clostridiales bacterium]